ncbi:MAG: adenine nucleotide alpha hydrolase [Porticoccus sp.]|nr:adenine nucleotide alpha hydrolase [Porticoccus sp.]
MTDLSLKKKVRVLLSWSSGKDSAWALYQLQQNPEVEVVGLLTTFNSEFGRSAIHGVRLELIRAQAEAAELPLLEVALPWPCSNEQYEQLMSDAIDRAKREMAPDAVAFGDLFLEDIRQYREERMADTGLDLIFPIWGIPTKELADSMIESGLQAYLTCLDPTKVPETLAGHAFDRALLKKLPEAVDRCGENGEFHTFAWSGPMFYKPVEVTVGETVKREGFVYTDLMGVL